MTRRRHAPFDHGQPISRIDTMPLLLFSFTLVALFLSLQTTPTHALVIDLPAPFPEPVAWPERRSEYRIGIANGGQVSINATPVSDEDLPGVFQAMAIEPISPRVLFDPEPSTPYPRALEVLGAIKTSGLIGTHFCFAYLERYRHFDKSWRATPMRLTLLPPSDDLPSSRPLPPEGCHSWAEPPP